MGGWSESERISCQTKLIMHCIDSWGKYKKWFKLQYLIYKKLLKNIHARNVGMKWIRRNILQNTNTKNAKVAFKKEIQNKKSLSQKFAPNISKLDHSKKNHTCNSSLGWIESERRSYQILNFVGFAKIFVINLS